MPEFLATAAREVDLDHLPDVEIAQAPGRDQGLEL
jgi:hypothetical protein